LRLDFTENQLLKKIEALPIENSPGAKWNYRNTNYVLLGILIHRVTGIFYADFLSGRIFKPIGMTSTRLISDKDIVRNRAAGYQWEDGELKNQDWVSPTFNSTADGALYFNVLDLAKWDAALYTTRLVGKSSLEKMWTVYRLNDGKPNSANYGFAWRIERQNGYRVLEHSGAWQGFTCNIARYPGQSLTVVVLTNLDADHARPEYMAQVVAGIAEPQLLPPQLTAIADREPRVRASLAALLDAIAGSASLRNLIAADFAQTLTPAQRKSMRTAMATLWPGGRLTLVQRGPSPEEGALTLSQFRLMKGSRSILVTFALNAKGKADLLFFEPDEEYRTREI
jgi:CubicO group peptidase (beta-lactamase class C family)